MKVKEGGSVDLDGRGKTGKKYIRKERREVEKRLVLKR